MTPARAVQQGKGQPQADFYQQIHAIADRLEPEYREAFRNAVERARDNIDEQALLSALQAKDIGAVESAIAAGTLRTALEAEGINRLFRRSVGGTAEAATDEFEQVVGVTMDFDATNPKAVLAAQDEAARLVTQVTEETRQAVREYVRDAWTDGVPPDRLARQIRGVVGLTSRQQKWVGNMRRDLEALRTATEDDVTDLVDDITNRRLDAATMQRVRSKALRDEVTPEFVDEVVERYEESMLNFRSTNISRTETIRAGNRGQQVLWEQAREDGLLQAERTQRVWQVTPDDRLCFICAPMAGQTVGLDEPFQSPSTGATAMVPPIHPMGRCAVGLTFDNE